MFFKNSPTKNGKTFTFWVEQHHIDEGVCKSPTQCMTALALKETNIRATYVAVRTNEIRVTERQAPAIDGRKHAGWTTYKVYHMPTPLARKIHHHDETQPGWRSRIRPFKVAIKLVSTRFIPEIESELLVAPTKKARQGSANRIKGI